VGVGVGGSVDNTSVATIGWDRPPAAPAWGRRREVAQWRLQRTIWSLGTYDLAKGW